MTHTTIGHTSLRSAVLAVALVGVAALSGCIGGTDDPLALNAAPAAVLEVDRAERWTGETFAFNASASSDPDGNITHYRFDLGDGTVIEAEDAENASHVEHVYEAGGAYTVTLTVTDDGGEDVGARSTTSALVVLAHERQEIPLQARYAAPVEDENASSARHAFTAGENATSYEADLEVHGMIPVGTTNVTFQVLDANGTLLEERNLTIDGTGNETVRLKGALEAAGDHAIRMLVGSGGASFTGQLRVYYDAPETVA